MIYIESKKKKEKTLLKNYPNAVIIDVTSKGKEPFVKLSPFYPIGNIPVPFSKNLYSYSVEGIWQGLKVFSGQDVDHSKFLVKDMKNIKRSSRKYGRILGHRKGVYGEDILDYLTARKEIYLPTYFYVLKNIALSIIDKLKEIAVKQDLVLLDYNTNCDIENVKKALSHAGLIKKFLEDNYIEIKQLSLETQPKIKKVRKQSKKERVHAQKSLFDK